MAQTLRRLRLLFLMGALTMLLSIGGFSALAQDARADGTPNRPTQDQLNALRGQQTRSLPGVGTLNANAATGENINAFVPEFATTLTDGRTLVIIELYDTPAAVIFAQAGGESAEIAANALADTQRVTVENAQNVLMANISSAGIAADVIGRTDTVMNSISVAVSVDSIAQLRALPNVKAVYPVRLYNRLDSNSVPTVGAPQAWAGLIPSGLETTGAGVVVSVLDSGIDYTHVALGGDGSFTTLASDRETVADGEPNFGAPTDKVIGGYDYVGDAFVGDNTPLPDDDPIDCAEALGGGHGTSVAGLIAGEGITDAGTNYGGPYNSVDYTTLELGPGMAPDAKLVAMRIFGCNGFTSDVQIIDAIDDSVSGVYTGGVQSDIVNMSLGAPYGLFLGVSPLDPYEVVTDNAALAGTVVVASAGNEGDSFYVLGSPSTASAAISVASTFDGAFDATITLHVAANGNYPASVTNSPALSTVAPRRVTYVTEDGCQASDWASFPVNRIAFLYWTGNCGSNAIHQAAETAPNRPVALVIANNVPNVFIALACSSFTFYIPCYSIQQSVGDSIVANIGVIELEIKPDVPIYTPDLNDVISEFSSRGPLGYFEYGLKPDVAAPGDYFLTAPSSGSGNGTSSFGGTSGAAPHVAGLVALLLSDSVYASWSPWQIKALVMNTANNDVYFQSQSSGIRIGPQRAGAGRIDVPDAFNSQVIAYNTDYPQSVNISFGFPEVDPNVDSVIARSVTLWNKGAASVSYDVSIDVVNDNNIASFAASVSTITVGAFDTAVVPLQLALDYADGDPFNYSDDSLTRESVFFGAPFLRHFMSEESGYLVLTPTTGTGAPLRVPLYAAPRPASSMRADSSTIEIEGDSAYTLASFALDESGTGVDSGTNFPEDIVSTVQAFRHMATDPLNDTTLPIPYLDLEQVGVQSDYWYWSDPSNTQVGFGLSMAADWASPYAVYLTVYIDANQDGFGIAADDWVVTMFGGPGDFFSDDSYLTLIAPAATFSGCLHEFVNGLDAGFNTYLFNTNVAELVFYPYLPLDYANTCGFDATSGTSVLEAGDTDFDFYVETASATTGTIIDVSDVIYFDMFYPLIDVGVLGNAIDDVPGNTFLYFHEQSYYPYDGLDLVPPGILLLHHHNDAQLQAADGENFRRAEVVTLDFDDLDLSVSIQSPSEATPGEEVTHTIEVSNLDAETTASSVLLDYYYDNDSDDDNALQFVSAPGACANVASSELVTCDLGAIAPSTTISIDIVFTVASDYAGEYETRAILTSSGIRDIDLSNNDASALTTVYPPAPTVIEPLGATTDNTPLYRWNEVGSVSKYEFWLTGPGDTYITSGEFPTAAICSAGVCEVDTGITHPDGVFKWWVRAYNDEVGYGSWTGQNDFTINVTITPTPIPTAPIGDIGTETEPDFVWDVAPGGEWYQIWVSKNGSYVYSGWYDQSAICTDIDTGTCTTSLPVTLTAGVHSWWVQAWTSAGGYSLWSSETQFTVSIPLSVPVVTAPIGTVSDTTPDFVWNASDGATWYQIWVTNDDTEANVFEQHIDQVIACTGGVCTLTSPITLTDGNYKFWLRAWSPDTGYSDWTGENLFAVAAL